MNGVVAREREEGEEKGEGEGQEEETTSSRRAGQFEGIKFSMRAVVL